MATTAAPPPRARLTRLCARGVCPLGLVIVASRVEAVCVDGRAAQRLALTLDTDDGGSGGGGGGGDGGRPPPRPHRAALTRGCGDALGAEGLVIVEASLTPADGAGVKGGADGGATYDLVLLLEAEERDECRPTRRGGAPDGLPSEASPVSADDIAVTPVGGHPGSAAAGPSCADATPARTPTPSPPAVSRWSGSLHSPIDCGVLVPLEPIRLDVDGEIAAKPDAPPRLPASRLAVAWRKTEVDAPTNFSRKRRLLGGWYATAESSPRASRLPTVSRTPLVAAVLPSVDEAAAEPVEPAAKRHRAVTTSSSSGGVVVVSEVKAVPAAAATTTNTKGDRRAPPDGAGVGGTYGAVRSVSPQVTVATATGGRRLLLPKAGRQLALGGSSGSGASSSIQHSACAAAAVKGATRDSPLRRAAAGGHRQSSTSGKKPSTKMSPARRAAAVVTALTPAHRRELIAALERLDRRVVAPSHRGMPCTPEFLQRRRSRSARAAEALRLVVLAEASTPTQAVAIHTRLCARLGAVVDVGMALGLVSLSGPRRGVWGLVLDEGWAPAAVGAGHTRATDLPTCQCRQRLTLPLKEEKDLCLWALLLAFRSSFGPRKTADTELDVASLRQTETLRMVHNHITRIVSCDHGLVPTYDRTCDRVRVAAFGPRSALLSNMQLLQQLVADTQWVPDFPARTSRIAPLGALRSPPSEFWLPPLATSAASSSSPFALPRDVRTLLVRQLEEALEWNTSPGPADADYEAARRLWLSRECIFMPLVEAAVRKAGNSDRMLLLARSLVSSLARKRMAPEDGELLRPATMSALLDDAVAMVPTAMPRWLSVAPPPKG